MTASNLVHVVDDDPSVLDAVGLILRLEGFEVATFRSGDQFLRAIAGTQPACIVLDVHMPGKSGLDILGALSAGRYPAPVLIISGQGDIPMAVQAIKAGAVDFLEKPFDADLLIERIRHAIRARAGKDEARDGGSGREFPGAERLSAREHDVLEQILAGARDKEAGRELGISPRTIETHRKSIMGKLGARNTAELLRIVFSGAG